MIPLAVTALALSVWPGRSGLACRRLVRICSDEPEERTRVRWNPIRLAAVGAGVAVVLLIPSPVGVLIGAIAGVLADRALRRLETGASKRARLECDRDFPIALDLLAVALRAGLPMSGAAALVATALGGPLADTLRRVGTLSALGADTDAAWAHVRSDPLWTDVVRAVERAVRSGSALSGLLHRVADEHRTALEESAQAAARRASVIAMAPLGLCFLPAFVCIGIVPVVIGLLAHAVI